MTEKEKSKVYIPNISARLPVPILDTFMITNLSGLALSLMGAWDIAMPISEAATYMMYAWLGTSAVDFVAKRGIKKIDFKETYGYDCFNVRSIPLDELEQERSLLVESLNDGYTSDKYERPELADLVDKHLIDYTSDITGQEVHTSTKIRGWGFTKLIMPFALGACDPLSGEVYLFQDTGTLEPHVVAHEFAHRKGYGKEMEAQALAYFSLINSGDPVLKQGVNCERLRRNFSYTTDQESFNVGHQMNYMISESGLRNELTKDFVVKDPEKVGGPSVMRKLYEWRMKITKQKSIRDYDQGFINFLYSVGEPVL